MKKRISKNRKASINKKHLPRKPSLVFSGLRAIAQKPSPMHGSKKSFEDDQHTAQETVEYIVILAVIVVIALVVVNLLSGFTVGTQGISNAPTEIIGMTGGTISIFEAVGDYTGEALF